MKEITILCKVAYDGTNYYGWQIQPDKATIQGTIEKKLSEIFKKKIKIQGAGRTDSGVHARGQYFSAKIPASFPLSKFLIALNTKLPNDISVYKLWKTTDNFNARYNAKMRWYRYRFFYSPYSNPFEIRYAYWIRPPFNWDAVFKAIKYFRGKHDFSSFKSAHCTAKRVELTISEFSYKIDGEIIYFDIKARSFLHNMIRIIMGTLWEIGMGKKKPSDIPQIIKAKDRKKAGKTLAANGLFFMDVEYDWKKLVEIK